MTHRLPRAVAAYIAIADRVSHRLGQLASWLVLAACTISAANAVVRYAFSLGSNAWLEVQWYLFAGTIFFGAPAILRLNEHVRVDVLYGGRSGRTKAWIDLLGFVFFFMPVCVAMVVLSLGFVEDSWLRQEMSSSAGGLIRWPVKALVPLGFALLVLQGLAEIAKRIGYLLGAYGMDTHYERPLQ